MNAVLGEAPCQSSPGVLKSEIVTVSAEEFERVRLLLEKAIADEFSKDPVPPAEVHPGHWFFWPYRDVELQLEETQFYNYGTPVGGTGRLQAHISYPYGNHDRIKPRPASAPFDKKLAERAAKDARYISDLIADNLHAKNLNKQKAYLFGYNAVFNASEEKRSRMWPAREATYKGERWDPLHTTIHNFFFDVRKQDPAKWDEIFSGEPQYKRPREWSPRERGYHGPSYDAFFSGAITALDDWSRTERFYD